MPSKDIMRLPTDYNDVLTLFPNTQEVPCSPFCTYIPPEICKYKSFNSFLFHQQTPLHLAAEKGRFENTLKYLVDKGADINIKDEKGVIVMLLYSPIN